MKKELEKLAIKLCEGLPFNKTFYEKGSFCQKPSDHCNYCEKGFNNKYLCGKKTYTIIMQQEHA